MANADETEPRRTHPIVIVLLVLLALGVVGGVAAKIGLDQVHAQSELARAARASADLRAMADAARLFKLDTGAWPTGIDDLWKAPPPLPAGKRWGGPYLDVAATPTDPWGRPYTLVAGTGFTFTCLGADGVAGGQGADADLVEGPE